MMQIEDFSLGSIRIGGTTYENDVWRSPASQDLRASSSA